MSKIQNGINWQRGTKPRSCFKLLFLETHTELATADLAYHLSQLWNIWKSLEAGTVPSVGAGFPVDPKGLQTLLGFGEKFFARDDLARPKPSRMGIWKFSSPGDNADASILPASGLKYRPGVVENEADAEIAVQFTANSQLAVNRCYVEAWKYLRIHKASDGEPLIKIKGFIDGFGREDKRSWIDFHDGTSNLRKGDQRRQVIAIKPETADGQDWALDGTYMVFMKLTVDLEVWNNLDERTQELLVGRKKGTGCPVLGINSNGTLQTDGRCPATGTIDVSDPENEHFREAPNSVSGEVKVSHIHRSNHHRPLPYKPDSRRIYRQGFEFFEAGDEAGTFRAGLNFVSFQDDPDRVFFILTSLDWLGNINFGGANDQQTGGIDGIISVESAGVYFVPPSNSVERFPGYDLFPVRTD